MQLKQGCEAAYIERHDQIWPDLVMLFKQNGIRDYHIYFDKATHLLIGVQCIEEHLNADLSENALMRKWWVQMADLMEINEDRSPVVVGLEKVFSMP